MQREFGDLQNLPQDLRSLGRFCVPQTVFEWDLDITYKTKNEWLNPAVRKFMLQLSYINSVKLHSYLSKMNSKLNFRPVENWVAV